MKLPGNHWLNLLRRILSSEAFPSVFKALISSSLMRLVENDLLSAWHSNKFQSKMVGRTDRYSFRKFRASSAPIKKKRIGKWRACFSFSSAKLGIGE